ncbi:hypothetical protein CSC74_10245 [Pseudoxanthomonas yeongjuensis]|jgi:hypothetical protein|nr:hypothetical protein CSC74_10245 [Pseudoxanthomonas yeongjuensis]
MLHRSLLCLALACPAFAHAQTAPEQAAGSEAATPAEEPQAAATAEGTATAEAATPAEAPAAAEAASEEAVAASTESKIASPPAGKGQIVFFRDKKFVGGGVSYKVREGETELGKLSNGTYFVYIAEPGAHQYTVHSEAKDILNMEVEAGETYYVTGGITMGVFAGRPNLSPSDEVAFNALEGKLKPAKPLKKK